MPRQVENMSVDQLQAWACGLIDRHEKIRNSLLELNDPEDVACIMDAAAEDLAAIVTLLSEQSPEKPRVLAVARSLMSRQKKTFPEHVWFGRHVERWATQDETRCSK
jgi:hypothetical protein